MGLERLSRKELIDGHSERSHLHPQAIFGSPPALVPFGRDITMVLGPPIRSQRSHVLEASPASAADGWLDTGGPVLVKQATSLG